MTPQPPVPPAAQQPSPALPGESQPLRLCPTFHPALLAQDMTIDTAYRWGSLVVLVVTILLGASLPGPWQQAPNILALGVVISWVMVSAQSTRVWRTMPRIMAMMDQNPTLADAELAGALRRRLLHRAVRLMLYHRLAVLRHRQQRFGEVAAICQAVLRYDLGSANHLRPHLLLMLVESQLLIGDLPGAYQGLLQLSQTKLNLIEATQRLALQTRYQVASGYYDRSLEGLEQTLALAELMPPGQCGAIHAMLAFAARHAQRHDLASWLQQRAELLCTPEELNQLAQSGAMPAGA